MKRFWEKVEKTDSCWNWKAAKNSLGYGRFLYEGKNRHAHRIAWIISGYKIKDGYVLDHMCRNSSCVNPKHIRCVDIRTNVLENSLGFGAINIKKTACPLGHKYDEIKKGGNKTWRSCSQCRKTRDKQEYRSFLANGGSWKEWLSKK